MGKKIAKVKETSGQIAEQVTDMAVDARTGIAGLAKKGAEQAQKGIDDTSYKMRLKYYNPLFPDVYSAAGYTLPQVVVIEDGDDRKNIDVCEGAIGWTSQEAKLTVVHLYRSFIEESGVTFYPFTKTNAVYMGDPSNSKRYIELSCFFSTIENEKIAELIEIGRCLGAKKCSVKIYEAAKQVVLKKGNAKAKGKGKIESVAVEVGAGVEGSSDLEKQTNYATLSFQEFSGSDAPQRPALHWFANDAAITNLVDSFFDDRSDLNPTHVRREVSRSSSCTMNSKMAGKVGAALNKLGAQLNFSIEGEAKDEERKTWVLDIVFK